MKRGFFFLSLAIIFNIAVFSETVYFWHVFQGPLEKTFDSIVNDFNKSHADIEVKTFALKRYSNLLEKLKNTQQYGGEMPDIFLGYSSWLKELNIEKIGLAGKLLSSETLGKLDTVMLEDASYNSKQFGLPFNKSIMLLYINTDLLDTNEVDPDNYTAEQFLKFLKDVKKETALTPLSSNASVWFFENLLLNLGGSMDNVATKEGAKAMDLLREGFRKKLIKIKSGYSYQDYWTSQEVPLTFTSIVSLRFMEKKIDFDFIRKNVLKSKSGKHRSVLSGSNIFISKSGEKKNGLKVLLNWLYRKENLEKWFSKSGYLPLYKNMKGGEFLENLELVLEPATNDWHSKSNKLSTLLKNSLISSADSMDLLKKVEK